jgi:hypothetical protein
MSSIITRAAKGSPLTHAEVDANFTNLNTDKAETAAPTFTGQVKVAAGTAAAPSLTVTGDPNTGIYSPGADQVAISTNGTGRLFVDASGNVGVGSASPQNLLSTGSAAGGQLGLSIDWTGGGGPYQVAGLTADNSTGEIRHFAFTNYFPTFYSNNTERARIDSSGRLLVGASTAQAGAGGSDLLQVTGAINVVSSTNVYSRLLPTASGLEIIANAYPANLGSTQSIIFKSGTSGGGGPFEIARFTSDGRVGIGTNTPTRQLHVNSTAIFDINGDGTGTNPSIAIGSTSVGLSYVGGSQLSFTTGSAEKARLTSDGKFLVGTSTGRDPSGESKIESFNGPISVSTFVNSSGFYGLNFIKSRGTSSNVIVQNNDSLSAIRFFGADGTAYPEGARIEAYVDGAPGANDMPGRLVFSTTADGAASPTERMRITSAGEMLIGRTSALSTAHRFVVDTSNLAVGINTSNGGSNEAIRFYNAGTAVGTISTTGSATAYNTSSDYRLKENVAAVADGITRLQQLKPSRFNFIANPDQTVDGFIAHEAQAVVPECVTGTKDAVDDDGNPVYQGIDQSKLVPLLTAALQEAIAKIENLEAKVAALEANQ